MCLTRPSPPPFPDRVIVQPPLSRCHCHNQRLLLAMAEGCPTLQLLGLGTRLKKNLGLRTPLLKLSTQPLTGLVVLLTPHLLPLEEKETEGRHRGGLEETKAVGLPLSRC